jgi:hypothetical protein
MLYQNMVLKRLREKAPMIAVLGGGDDQDVWDRGGGDFHGKVILLQSKKVE